MPSNDVMKRYLTDSVQMKEMEGLSEVIKDQDKIDMQRLIFASHNDPLSTQVSIK